MFASTSRVSRKLLPVPGVSWVGNCFTGGAHAAKSSAIPRETIRSERSDTGPSLEAERDAHQHVVRADVGLDLRLRKPRDVAVELELRAEVGEAVLAEETDVRREHPRRPDSGLHADRGVVTGLIVRRPEVRAVLGRGKEHSRPDREVRLEPAFRNCGLATIPGQRSIRSKDTSVTSS